jgi:hypothetical protein
MNDQKIKTNEFSNTSFTERSGKIKMITFFLEIKIMVFLSCAPYSSKHFLLALQRHFWDLPMSTCSHFASQTLNSYMFKACVNCYCWKACAFIRGDGSQ